ncbi:helix-turn-helix transcriptional regulator [Microbacterium suaedae]|uniref:helix-turn-helix transcriptional regulator n=1 Tax=Microbacterium suaedae TaxID=2067813 RepID=UPI000DA13321|nr:helix-turn-helix transcriptional regulator [Microbacterium suaedae]
MRNSLHERRLDRGWSQQRLADELGVSRQTVISIERGRFDPSLPLAFRLAEVFDCRIDELFDPKAAGTQPN